MEWKLIQSAPRNGNHILIANKHGVVGIGRFGCENHEPYVPESCFCSPDQDGCSYDWIFNNIPSLNFSPTHWMPLPEPPKLGGE